MPVFMATKNKQSFLHCGRLIALGGAVFKPHTCYVTACVLLARADQCVSRSVAQGYSLVMQRLETKFLREGTVGTLVMFQFLQPPKQHPIWVRQKLHWSWE